MDQFSLTVQRENNILDVVNGGHLHWSEFRHNVLQSFRIKCSNTPRTEHIPTPFLARLQSTQKNKAKYDEQRRTWRSKVATQRGIGLSPIFPPYLIPLSPACDAISRCMMPRMSREGLPLRDASIKKSLYELPTAKPFYACGFNLDVFDKSEQYQLSGALKISGSVVDFEKGEVATDTVIGCPFLVFEKIATNTQEDIETARNHCAVVGAQNLRGQQQLFHKAFGLQTVSQPPVTFSCAISNDQAFIHFHCVDEDGTYTMAALCKFDLQDDDHFNTFQIWIEAIESWASIYLLPRIKGALSQTSLGNQTPPPSPPPSFNSLSIDTNSSNIILSTLRRYWPDIAWQQEGIAETPINSSIAQCGTPMPVRNLYSSDCCLPSTTPVDEERHPSPSKRLLDVLSPIRTDLLTSQRIQTPRPLSAISTLSRDFFDDRSTSTASPCRPPSLSPSSPEPEAPINSKSPMLVLQRRLDIAVNEIQELRDQVENLQNTLVYKTEKLEKWLEMASESKQATPIAPCSQQTLSAIPAVEEVPTIMDGEDVQCLEIVPGDFPAAGQAELAELWQDMLNWRQELLQKYGSVELILIFLCAWLGCSMATMDIGSFIFNLVFTAFITC